MFLLTRDMYSALSQARPAIKATNYRRSDCGSRVSGSLVCHGARS